MDPLPDQAPVQPPSSSVFATLSTTNTTVDSLNLARKKHEDRAKRFGVEYVEPKLETVNGKAPKRYINPRKSGFVTGFSLDNEEEKRKRELRAKKFGITAVDPSVPAAAPATSDTVPSTNASDDVPNNGGAMDDGGMELDIREERKDVGADVQRRLDTIYLYGTDDMSTEDVFRYFKDYGPESIEWINDSSCNIIFRDVNTAGRALQGMSKPVDDANLQINETGAITTTSTKPSPSTAPQTETTTTSSTVAQQPPSVTLVQATPEQITLYGWRKGTSVKGVPILMRYATAADVKSKEFKPSAYYKKTLAQLRAKASQKNKKKHNKRHTRDQGPISQENKSSKRKHDDEGDIEMLDPAEQEKRSQRRKRFFPEREELNQADSNFIISSDTVPALLQDNLQQPVLPPPTTDSNPIV